MYLEQARAFIANNGNRELLPYFSDHWGRWPAGEAAAHVQNELLNRANSCDSYAPEHAKTYRDIEKAVRLNAK